MCEKKNNQLGKNMFKTQPYIGRKKSTREWNQYFEKILTESRPQWKDIQNGNPSIVVIGCPIRITKFSVPLI